MLHSGYLVPEVLSRFFDRGFVIRGLSSGISRPRIANARIAPRSFYVAECEFNRRMGGGGGDTIRNEFTS